MTAEPITGWHPEPDLLVIRDPSSRDAMREAGDAIWAAALDYLYDHALVRAMGTPSVYDALRAEFFGATRAPAPAPREPATLQAVLDEFSSRVAPHTVRACQPRSFGYFTPLPLLASVAGEVLAQLAPQAIARDRAAGLTPLAIAAVAGSTNTGSVDATGELADLAAREDLWLHVDAAYAAAARLSARDAGRVADLERADSVTVDPHKWLFQSYDIGGLVVRDGGVLAQAFGGRRPEYYRAGHELDGSNGHAPTDDGHGAADQLNFWRLGFEGTRRWRALKLWLSWKHIGSEGFGRLVEANIDLAAHLAARIAASDDFEALPAEPELSVVCFRHLPAGRPGPEPGTPAATALDAHQDRLQRALEASGEGWLSTTRLRGATYLRAGILNTQSTAADVDELLAILRRLARGA